MSELSKTSVNKLTISVFYDLRTRSSFCWKYFGHLVLTSGGKKKKVIKPEQVYCLACLDAVKEESEEIAFGCVKIKAYNKSVSTGNLTRHLRDEHQITQVRTDTPSSDDAKTYSTNTTKAGTMDINNKWILAKDLALLCCKSLLPFDSVSDEGMMGFFKKYNIVKNIDDLPARDVVRGAALSDVYESLIHIVKDTITDDAERYCALAFDLWTDQSRGLNYITFSLHYLTPDFVLKRITLNTEMLTDKIAGQNINNAIENTMTRFALDGKDIIAVTPSGNNIKQAVSRSNMTHHLCLGHGLHNLITVDGIHFEPKIAVMVHKCKKIVESVTYRASELQLKTEKEELVQQLQFLRKLDEVMETLERDETDPVPQIYFTPSDTEIECGSRSDFPSAYYKNVPTRWQCILELLNVIHVCNQETINYILHQIHQEEHNLSQMEWILLEDLRKFLESFCEAVDILSSQKTCTLNVALVFRSEIIDVLNSVDGDESVMISRMKRKMLANIDKRFPVTEPIVAAALLDSRFMNLKEIDVYLENHGISTRASFLSSYIKEVISVSDMPESSGIQSAESVLLQKLLIKHSSSIGEESKKDHIEQECWRYIIGADVTEPKNGNLLSYWNRMKEAFPCLAALARVLLGVPATSASAHHVFSLDSLTITAKRSRLSPNKANKIIFVHNNHKMYRLIRD